jgi:Zn-dependent protease
VIGLTVHEWAHAYTAYRLGDLTAKEDGRLSLNPLRHIDPLGFVFLIIAGFGWAKPVRFSREVLKRPKLDEATIAAAGPLSNLLLAILGAVALRLLYPLLHEGVVATLLLYFVYLNLGLFVFNLIPLPPLDGSHIAFSALRLKPELEARLYRYGSYALLAIIIIGNFSKVNLLPIGQAVRWLARGMFRILGL